MKRQVFIRNKNTLAGPFKSTEAAHKWGKANLQGYRIIGRRGGNKK